MLKLMPSTAAAPAPKGKYLLTLTSAPDKTMLFQVELAEDAVKGKKGKTPARSGYTKGLWTLQWTLGKQTVILVARPEGGAPKHGGFVLHEPGAETLTGDFTLEPATPASSKKAEPFEKVGDFLKTLR